jgi:acyl-coenzyme A thioesterase PaaI-like protein
VSVTHHDLCFGCGLANLFGLQLEAELDGDASLAGRCFVKQDHQGPPGYAHGGILATVLDEAMALLVHGLGIRALTRRLEVDLRAPAPVGAFVHVRARVEVRDGERLTLRAELAGDDERKLATATGVFAILG